MRPRASLRLLLALAAALAAPACGGDGGGDGERSGPPELEGAVRLVTSMDRWSYLAVPRDGGTVQARSISDPSAVLWEGETELPPLTDVRLLDGPLLVLRTGEGEVLRYDPRTERLATLEAVAADAAWSAWNGYGVWREEAGGLLEVGPDGSWRYRLAASPLWASPVEGGRMAVLVSTGEGHEVWLVARGASEPEASAGGSFRPPAMTTAWGRRLVLSAEEGLATLDVPSLSPAGTIELDARPAVLAASPSSHELYAGLAEPASVVRISRFTSEAERMTRLPRPPRAIRPAVLGDFLLVHDGGEPLLLPLDGSGTERLAGDWRTDLPLGTPDGRVLAVVDGELRLLDPDGAEPVPVEAPADRWWAAVPWNPAPPTRVASREAEGREELGFFADTGAAEADTAGPPTEATESGREGPPAGFYAVVTAARDPDGVRRLLEELSGAGYPTELQRYTDDAGRTWYRGMVGSYPAREEAEAAARQLRRERDVDAWITEVRAGTSDEEVLR